MRRGVPLIVTAVLVAALAAAAARAAGTSGTTTTGTTTTGTTTTTTTGTTTTTPSPTYVPLTTSSLPASCLGAGVAALREPGKAAVVLGKAGKQLAASDYPKAKPFLELDSATPAGARCRTEGITLANVSLFDGAVTATSLQATNGKGTADGLTVEGGAVTAKPGQAVALGNWGLLRIQFTSGRLSAPLAVQLLRAHDSLPKGTTIFLAFAATRQVAPPKPKPPATTTTTTVGKVVHHAKRHAHAKPTQPQPLKQTPPLGLPASDYVFPIDGGASFIDTYGMNRNDIYDGWHHGDDLFAPLGTPVVAVANGTLSFVGWNSLGGWRVWLTDAKGNSFYYAHLSGYAADILRHRHVRAGQVIGFLGRTGDAFTTEPHVHFEIHPHQLVKLGYDGAVDPTTYLKAWRVETLPNSAIPAAARLRAPSGTPAQEAEVVWRQLLAARHLQPDGEPIVGHAQPLYRSLPGTISADAASRGVERRLSGVSAAAHVPVGSDGGTWRIVLGLALAASLLVSIVGFRRRRRGLLAREG